MSWPAIRSAGRPPAGARRPDSCAGRAFPEPASPSRSTNARAPAGLGPGRPPVLQPDRSVVQSGPPGQQQVTLRHQRPARQPLPRRGGVLGADQPGVSLQEAGDDPQQGRLAPAAGPNEPHLRQAGDLKVDARQGNNLAEDLPYPPKFKSEGTGRARHRCLISLRRHYPIRFGRSAARALRPATLSARSARAPVWLSLNATASNRHPQLPPALRRDAQPGVAHSTGYPGEPLATVKRNELSPTGLQGSHSGEQNDLRCRIRRFAGGR
jgi:hypothetical protein